MRRVFSQCMVQLYQGAVFNVAVTASVATAGSKHCTQFRDNLNSDNAGCRWPPTSQRPLSFAR